LIGNLLASVCDIFVQITQTRPLLIVVVSIWAAASFPIFYTEFFCSASAWHATQALYWLAIAGKSVFPSVASWYCI